MESSMGVSEQMDNRKMPDAIKLHTYAVLEHSKAVHRKRQGCSDPKLRGLPDGGDGVERVSGNVAKNGYRNRCNFDWGRKGVSKMRHNGYRNRTAGTGTKGRTLVMTMFVRRS
jgi:hypothetical protein